MYNIKLDVNQIIQDYKNNINNATSEIEKQEFLKNANKLLEGSPFSLMPDRCSNVEKIVEFNGKVEEISGYGILDTGIGRLDKVQINRGRLTNPIGVTYGLVTIGGIEFEVTDGFTLGLKRQNTEKKKKDVFQSLKEWLDKHKMFN